MNGLGGKDIQELEEEPIDESLVAFDGDFGAMIVEAGRNSLNLIFFDRHGTEIDYYHID